MNYPLVSVIMPVYNGERYLREAMESILNQTFTDFEFIIVNDGSTDGTAAILKCYQQKDKRVHVCHQENRGIVSSLNRGCRLAKGKYIARMDADDVSLVTRFAKQVEYMEAHPEVGVLGTWIEYIDKNGAPHGVWHMPTSPAVIGWSLLFGTCLAHPSVMMRQDIIKQIGFYHPEALHVEDYDLWARASVVTQIANLPEDLLKRRVCGESVCSNHQQTQEQNVIKIMQSMATRLMNSEVSIEEVEALRYIVIGSFPTNFQQIKSTVNFLLRLYRAYIESNSLSSEEAIEIAHDAGIKFYTLAVPASKVSLLEGLAIFIQALRLNPRLLSVRSLIRFMRRKAF